MLQSYSLIKQYPAKQLETAGAARHCTVTINKKCIYCEQLIKFFIRLLTSDKMNAGILWTSEWKFLLLIGQEPDELQRKPVVF